jgi:glycogen debranching enzyme
VKSDDQDRYQVVVTSSTAGPGARVLKQGNSFAVMNEFGDVDAEGEQGIYHLGTRYVSSLSLSLGDCPFLLLSSRVLHDNLVLAVDLTNPDVQDRGRTLVPHGSLHVWRSKFLRDGVCYERLRVANYGSVAVDTPIRIAFEADFADVFEVRGTRRERRGVVLPAVVEGDSVVLAYRGLDDRVRATRLAFAPAPDEIGPEGASFHVSLDAKQTKDLYVWITCDAGVNGSSPCPYERVYADAESALAGAQERECSIHTSNEEFNELLNRAQADLRMMITDTPHGPYPYAGVPWFSTPFGRDGIWTAIESMWLNPDWGAGALRFLAATQADRSMPERDAEAGKIIHEMRDGEMAALGEVPFGSYYGSVDATCLFVMLAERYFDLTADRGLIESIWPNLMAALQWMDRHGDLDGDGFIEYGRRSPDGLIQQGWKDSNDSVFHQDGTLADGPIALCEVQGYAYGARMGLARLARMRGDDGFADRLEGEAARFRDRFDQAFWCDELDMYALALDGRKMQCRVRSSNAGHCLFTGIALPERAERIASAMGDTDMFSGWGIRTLSSAERRYNPMSYHNGSIWPHDNAIVGAGLATYGYKEMAARILGGLFDASLFIELHRLPELFCGFERRPGGSPTVYPVACSPQAWASAAPFLLLAAILGLSIDGVRRVVTLTHPLLPTFLEDVLVRNLRVGDATVDFRLHRYPDDVGVNVLRRTGSVEFVIVK